jgi:sialic acid synthase SpsE/sugar phosphate isomerase/epimerase
MLVERINKNFLIFSNEPLKKALEKIDVNLVKIVFVIESNNQLIGSLTDGDIRRFLINNPKANIQDSLCVQAMNPDPKMYDKSQSSRTIASLFTEGVTCLPVVDSLKRIVQVIFKDLDGFYIGSNQISNTSESFIIAEIGNNHQGRMSAAKKLVDKVKDSGANCAKFQMRNIKNLYKSEGKIDDSADLGAQYTMDLLSKYQLANDELFEVFDYCYEKGIKPLCTPWDLDSLELLESYGMEAYKIASADLTNFELLEAAAATGKPLICSTGMSAENEITATYNFLRERGVMFCFLHCNSTYPTPYRDINLNYMNRLSKITNDNLVGYSGHDRGHSVVLGAIAMGAKIIEKHITLDKNQKGTDHKVSLLPKEFKNMVNDIRNLEEAMGSIDSPRQLTQGEMINRENLAKSLVANQNIEKGTKITRDLVTIKSPGLGLQPNMIDSLIGKKAIRDIQNNDFFYKTDIEGIIQKKSNYSFSRPFGVPVRYHDFLSIKENTNLDFVEFHLSYQDMDLDINNYLSGTYDIDFCVHSPELFAEDHILDLCSKDDDYIKKSKTLLQEVINITRELVKFFPKTEKPIIVLNAGGWNKDGFISAEEIALKYSILEKALKDLDIENVQIAIQTMPPFPWHFGGQSFHNLFIKSEDIIKFCENNKKIKICLDVSHSMMAANYFGFDLYKFIQDISPYVVHMHVVDALGYDGEGVEIGKGDVDFDKLANVLYTNLKGVQFLPEVWQGHKNKGEGFWKALNFLNKKF